MRNGTASVWPHTATAARLIDSTADGVRSPISPYTRWRRTSRRGPRVHASTINKHLLSVLRYVNINRNWHVE